MRVLIVNRLLGTLLGGGETFDLNVARHLAKLGHDVTIITKKPLFSHSHFLYPDLKVIYLPALDLHILEAKARHINQILGAALRYIDMYIFERIVFSWLFHNKVYQQCDIIQCCSMFWFPKWVITRFNIPVVSWLPGPPPRLKRRLICSLVSHPHFGLFAHGDTVKVLEDELGFVRGIEFEVIEPGVDLSLAEAYDPQKDVIRSNLNISSETVVGITVARLIPIKNIHFLIEGLALSVHELGVSIVWLIVGDGPERSSLKQLVKAKGLEGCVHWLGQMQQSEVHRILAAGDIFALTSTYESFSMATLEAMAHRLPIVATNVGYLRTIVQESGGGILVNLRDFKGLAQAIAMLASDPDYRRQLGDRGHIYVQRFNWPNIIAKLLRFYELVMVGRPCMKS